jgi:Uma2 family endonuclease
MVAIPKGSIKIPKVKLPKARLLTYEEYARLTPPDNGNYELHNGQIIFMPTPIPAHQLVSANLLVEIYTFAKKNNLGRVISAPMDTVFTPTDVLQPDLLFLSTARLHLIGEKKIEGAPDLVIEILSPSNGPKEMSYKKFIYEITEVREYWVINIDKKIITQYEKIENEFHIRTVFQEKDMLTSIVLEGFSTSVQALFE